MRTLWRFAKWLFRAVFRFMRGMSAETWPLAIKGILLKGCSLQERPASGL